MPPCNDDAHADAEIAGLRTASDAVIYGHVFGSPDREVGGVLVGRMAADGGLPLVTGAIPALRANEQRATLTFTHETWAHVHRILESEFPPDEQIVGWYHSHPGFGVFLSGHDLFIHENFFTGPSQIAVVIDPHALREGVFAWHGPQLIALFERATPSGWVVDRPSPEPSAAAHQTRMDDSARHMHNSGREGGGYPLLALAIAALIGVILGFGIWSLAEGVAGAQPSPRADRATSVRIDRKKSASTPKSHSEAPGDKQGVRRGGGQGVQRGGHAAR